MRNLDSWLARTSSSAPELMQNDPTNRAPSPKRPRGLRAPSDFRTNELIDELREKRVLWCPEARGFYSSTARKAAYKSVADAMNRCFPELRPWHYEEVDGHWRLLCQYQYACLTEHGPNGKPHTFTCRFERMSFMDASLRACTNWRTFIPPF
jgi:hypothetical protein